MKVFSIGDWLVILLSRLRLVAEAGLMCYFSGGGCGGDGGVNNIKFLRLALILGMFL